MDLTPHHDAQNEDSGCHTGSFENSKIRFESTPNATPTTSLEVSRKRKAPPALTDIIEACPTPQFSSTLNESLLSNLEQCRITPNYYVERSDFEEKPVKYAKLNDSKPLTPVKEKSICNESPYKELNEILYPTKPVIPARKTLTPQKGACGKWIYSPAKKRLFETVRLDPMKYFAGNALVLEKIFENLSDGDLYRASMVSKTWNCTLMQDAKACGRYSDFVERHRVNKENYSITPPDSPPSPKSPPVSPGRRQFHAFIKVAKTLAEGQTLHKCPACSRPSVMEKNIGQCQNPNCGYIYCALCLSFSTTGPEDFHDKCQKSQLVVDRPRRSSRFGLSDLSNSDLERSTIFPETSHASSRADTSGYVSEMDSPLNRVKRNLNRRFSADKISVLTENNNKSVVVSRPRGSGKRRRPLLVPVVSNEAQGGADVLESPSPQKVKEAVAGSKQSKKNLRRLLI